MVACVADNVRPALTVACLAQHFYGLFTALRIHPVVVAICGTVINKTCSETINDKVRTDKCYGDFEG